MAQPPASYDVISRNHSNWPSLNFSQNVREGQTNSYWKFQVLMFNRLGKDSEKPKRGVGIFTPSLYIRGSFLPSVWSNCCKFSVAAQGQVFLVVQYRLYPGKRLTHIMDELGYCCKLLSYAQLYYSSCQASACHKCDFGQSSVWSCHCQWPW